MKNKFSLRQICENIGKKINQKLQQLMIYAKLKKEDLFKEPNKQIIFRKYKIYEEEEKNDIFPKHLADLADIYVNDAFSCSHRGSCIY